MQCGKSRVSLVQASADVLAMAALEVDLTTIKEGNTMTVKWRGKPVFVKHRTDVEIEREQAVALSDLRDPETDAARVVDPKVFSSGVAQFCCVIRLEPFRNDFSDLSVCFGFMISLADVVKFTATATRHSGLAHLL